MITEDQAIAESAVYRELVRGYRTEVYDLTKIWLAGGRKKGRSPRQWAAREDFSVPMGNATSPCLVDEGAANQYACHLCPTVQMRLNSILLEAFRNDPVRYLMDDPSGLMSLILAPQVA